MPGGSIAGIALVLMGFLPLVEAMRSPVVGFATLGLLLFVLVAKGRLPLRLPGVFAVFLIGVSAVAMGGAFQAFPGGDKLAPFYVLALVFLLFRPQGLFGEKIIDRV